MTIELDMRVEQPAWIKAVEPLEQTCLYALRAIELVSEVAGEVSLLLTDDPVMQTLNRDWRGKDEPTDILSFSAPAEARPFLGDIAISYGIASRDAAQNKIVMNQHLSHLLIHGYLHLIGYDHIDDTEAAKMQALEVAALASLGWPDPYM